MVLSLQRPGRPSRASPAPSGRSTSPPCVCTSPRGTRPGPSRAPNARRASLWPRRCANTREPPTPRRWRGASRRRRTLSQDPTAAHSAAPCSKAAGRWSCTKGSTGCCRKWPSVRWEGLKHFDQDWSNLTCEFAEIREITKKKHFGANPNYLSLKFSRLLLIIKLLQSTTEITKQ